MDVKEIKKSTKETTVIVKLQFLRPILYFFKTFYWPFAVHYRL